MTKFFDSEIIQKELREINDLQDFVYKSILTFGMLSREGKLNHIEKLSELLDKQRIMYTRLSLSDDPDAIAMKESLRQSVALMGFAPETDMNVLFGSISKTIESLRAYLD